MRKNAITVVLVLVIFLLGITAIQMKVTEANFVPAPQFSVKIFSPENTTYHTNDITLNFSIEGSEYRNTARYRLDGGNLETVANLTLVSSQPMPPEDWFGEKYNWTLYTYMGSTEFNGLSDGNHSLSVYNGYVSPHGFISSGDQATVNFIVDINPDKQTAASELISPIAAVMIATIVTIASIVISFPLYRRHRKVSNQQAVSTLQAT